MRELDGKLKPKLQCPNNCSSTCMSGWINYRINADNRSMYLRIIMMYFAAEMFVAEHFFLENHLLYCSHNNYVLVLILCLLPNSSHGRILCEYMYMQC